MKLRLCAWISAEPRRVLASCDVTKGVYLQEKERKPAHTGVRWQTVQVIFRGASSLKFEDSERCSSSLGFNFPVSGPKVQGRSGPAKPRKQTHLLWELREFHTPWRSGRRDAAFSSHTLGSLRRAHTLAESDSPPIYHPFVASLKFYSPSWLLQDFKTCFNWNISKLRTDSLDLRAQ